MADAVDHLAGIVKRAVVGAQLDDRQPKRACVLRPLRCHTRNLGADIGFIKTMLGNAADKAVGIAGGFHIHRDAAGQSECALVHRFVVVAVKQHQIALSHQGADGDFIRRAGAAEHKIGFVGIKHFGRMGLRLISRAFVNQ